MSGQMTKSEYLKEYSVVVTRLNAVETWSHQFVSLYFVFLAAIMAGVGYFYFRIDQLNQRSIDFVNLPLGNLVIGILTSLGFFLTFWAVLMLLHYRKRTSSLIAQLARIEDGFRDVPNDAQCFAQSMKNSNAGILVLITKISVAFVMLTLLLGWLLLFLILRS